MKRAHQVMIVCGVVVAVGFGAFMTFNPGWGIPFMASTSPSNRREYAAAMLGLLVLGAVAVGMEWDGF